jgi:hypothetical protein
MMLGVEPLARRVHVDDALAVLDALAAGARRGTHTERANRGAGARPRTVAVSGPDGKDFAVVLDRIDEVLGYASAQPGKLVVFFRRGQDDFAGEINLAARKLERTVSLPRS